MKKTFKKLLTVTLAFIVLFEFAPLADFFELFESFIIKAKAEEIATSGICGENLTWSFDETTGTLTIGGTGEMYDFENYPPWSRYEKEISNVLIGENVTSIGKTALDNLTSLENIAIPASITKIEDSPFGGCDNLTEINVAQSNSHYSSDEFGVLFDKEKKTLIKYPAACNQTLYTIPETVTVINGVAFNSCLNLVEVRIPDKVEKIGGSAFRYCYNLSKVNIPKNLSTIEFATFGSSGISSIVIPENVKKIEDFAFAGSNLENIQIHNNITDIGDRAFYGIPYSDDESNWNNDVLYLENYLIEARDTISGDYRVKDGTTLIAGSAFYFCTKLNSIYLPEGVTRICCGAFLGCGLKEIHLPDSLTSIGVCAFCDSDLEKITIPDNVISIEDGAFGSTKIQSITIPNSITSISEDTFNQSDLETIILPENLLSIEKQAFYGCWNLKNIIIPNKVNYIGNYSFSGCDRLTNINIPNCVTTIGEGAFEWCGTFSDSFCISLPENISTISEGMFRHAKISKITIHKSVTQIKDGAFYDCDIKDVYYTGTEEEWKKIEIGTVNENLLNATIHFNYRPLVIEHQVVKEPSQSIITYGDSITLHAGVQNLPDGAKITWSANNDNFEIVEISADGISCKITPKKSGDTTFTATIYDADNNIIAEDEQEMTSKAGFFDKIIAFFKKLFGLSKTYPQLYKQIF